MKASRNLWLVVLLALAVGTIAGLVLTGRAPSIGTNREPNGAPTAAASEAGPIINQQRLSTARSLASLASTPDEQRLAADAIRAADAEVDLAFASALRATSEELAGAKTPETRAIEERIRQAKTETAANQQELARLNAEAKTAPAAEQETLQGEIQVAEAELDLSKDALDDARDDLVRAGGDPHSRIQQLLDEHEALEHSGSGGPVTISTSPLTPSLFASGSLIGRWRDWSALRSKRARIELAQRDALAGSSALARSHQELETQVQGEQRERQSQTESAAGSSSSPSAPQPAAQSTADAVASLRRLSADEKNLADLDNRVQDLQHVASTYAQWMILVAGQERFASRGLLSATLWILLTLLVAVLAHRGADRLFGGLNLERKQRGTLRAIVRFSVQVLAVVVILLVVFGVPRQLSTVLGLAGAGLTVALKDFIVSFLGWFVLMGRNGVRVGDWVEINGVRGEVIEIGLLRTVLLETGNWTDAGQPTGRQVAFLNSYAVEGYYFNFTTSGQWLWDEIQVLVPAGRDPYPLIEQIREIVAKETERNQQPAEQEWQRVTRRYGMKPFPSEPTVNVKPTGLGVQAVVRYITRAQERSEVRYRLNHAVVKLLHQKQEAKPEGLENESVPAPFEPKRA